MGLHLVTINASINAGTPFEGSRSIEGLCSDMGVLAYRIRSTNWQLTALLHSFTSILTVFRMSSNVSMSLDVAASYNLSLSHSIASLYESYKKYISQDKV